MTALLRVTVLAFLVFLTFLTTSQAVLLIVDEAKLLQLAKSTCVSGSTFLSTPTLTVCL